MSRSLRWQLLKIYGSKVCLYFLYTPFLILLLYWTLRTLYFCHRFHLYTSYNSQNKKLTVPYTPLIDTCLLCKNNVLSDRPELMAFSKELTHEEPHCHKYSHMTHLKKYTQHSKAIRIAGCLTTVSVLGAVPVHQMKLQSKWDMSAKVDHKQKIHRYVTYGRSCIDTTCHMHQTILKENVRHCLCLHAH
jgi:hypothetical protein